MTLFPATEADLPAVARLWHDSWHDGHARHVPEALRDHRTLESFARRLPPLIGALRLARNGGDVLGMCVVQEAEVDQLFVAPEARGKGAAAELLADAEARIRATGADQGHLFVIKENLRARAFYEKHGWQDAGPQEVVLRETGDQVRLVVRRYEKAF